MSLSKLIQDCQVELFNCLPLTDSIQLRATCRTLNVSFFVHSQTRQSITLKVGKYRATELDDLVCRSLNSTICNFLFDTFPRITHLTIVLDKKLDSLLMQICFLFNNWSSRLVSLTIDLTLSVDSPTEHHNISTFIKCINRLPVLTSLHLKRNLQRFKSCKYDLPILGRLEHFTFNGHSINDIYDSLLKYALPNEQLRTICLETIYPDGRKNDLFNQDAAFTRKFTSINNFPMAGLQLPDLAPKFTSLQNLHLALNFENFYLPFNHVTSLLATHMPQLQNLKLTIDYDLFNENLPLDCTPLPSIKELSLYLYVTSHTNIRKHLDPGRTFPNLEKASTSVRTYRCTDCTIESTGRYDWNVKWPFDLPPCQDLLEQPFKECLRLVEPVRHFT